MAIDEIFESLENDDYINKKQKENIKLQQKAKTKDTIINILAVLCFPIALFVLVIAELIRTTE